MGSATGDELKPVVNLGLEVGLKGSAALQGSTMWLIGNSCPKALVGFPLDELPVRTVRFSLCSAMKYHEICVKLLKVLWRKHGHSATSMASVCRTVSLMQGPKSFVALHF